LLSLGILNNAFNWSDFIELNGMMISELWIGNHAEGKGRGLI
jgi:hypothetical protein